jgi:hypothetical protein
VAELAIACALLPVEISAPGTAPASRRYLSVRGRLSVRFFAALILCTQFSFFTVPRGRVNCEVRVSYFLRALVRVSSPNVNYIQTEAFRDSRSIVKLHSKNLGQIALGAKSCNSTLPRRSNTASWESELYEGHLAELLRQVRLKDSFGRRLTSLQKCCRLTRNCTM